MKFIAAVASAFIAVSLTGCSDDDSTTTAAPVTTIAPQATTKFMEATTKFMEPTSPSEVATTTSSSQSQQQTTAAPQTTGASGASTTTGSAGSSCKKPEGEYCGSAMGMPATVELHDNSFDLNVAGMINAKDIGYTMESDCTTVAPDWNNADLIKLAESLGMNTQQLSQFMKCSYNADTNVFHVSVAGALNLNLSPDQCTN